MPETKKSPDSPQKMRQNPRYVAMESAATILVIVGAILAARHVRMAVIAVIFVVAALLFLISALMNIQSIKAQQNQMKELESQQKEDSDVVETRPHESK